MIDHLTDRRQVSAAEHVVAVARATLAVAEHECRMLKQELLLGRLHESGLREIRPNGGAVYSAGDIAAAIRGATLEGLASIEQMIENEIAKLKAKVQR